MIRYPLLLSRLQRTPWAATDSAIYSVLKAISSPKIDSGFFAESSDERSRLATPKATKRIATMDGPISVDLAEPTTEKGIAVIPVHGIVGKYLSWGEIACGGGYDLRSLDRDLKMAAADPYVDEIVIEAVSPGGTCTGIAESSALIKKINQTKPVWAYTDAEMCSAMYWLSCSGSGVFASPLSSVGSIGVYLAWLDEAKALEMDGLELKLFRDGTFKAATLPGQLTTESGLLIQNEVNAVGTAFRNHVVSSRLDASDVEVAIETMQGQSFLGQDAVKVGLVDQLYNSIDDFISNLI